MAGDSSAELLRGNRCGAVTLHCEVSLLRIAAINFLNPAPLMWDFEHEPVQRELNTRYAINYTSPALCAERLREGSADIGLIPVAAYAMDPSLAIVPGCTIASLDHIRSILLVVRCSDGPEAARTVALDTSSRTSATYTKILFHKYWNPQAEFLPHAPNLEEMLARADAALLIGDPALYALADREARQQRTGECLHYLDLGHEWRSRTGLPWVSAFWGVRTETLAGKSTALLVDDFQQSRDHGLAHIPELVAEWSAKMSLPAAVVEEYLTRNIHYVLDDPCLAGLELFYRYAAECSALPVTPSLRLL